MAVDNVNHPSHYCNNKAGIEVIEVTAYLCFDLGNSFKYLARYKMKKLPAEDVKKAVFYMKHFRENLNSMHTYVVCSEEEIPALVKKMWKFCEVEDVQCVRRAMETITQAVIAEQDHVKPVKLPLLTEEQWKITIQALQNYAETIEDKKPEDFNG